MGYYDTTIERMHALLAHMVTTALDGSNARHLTCRSWLYNEVGKPLGWSWMATSRAVAALINEGYVEEAVTLPQHMSAQRKWLCTTTKGRAYYRTVNAEDSRNDPATVTVRTPDTTL